MRTFGAFERDFFVRVKAAFSGGYLLDVRSHVASGWDGFHSIHSAFYILNFLFTCERNKKIKGRSQRMPQTQQTASPTNKDRTEFVTCVHHKMQNNISCCKMFITATVALHFLPLLRGSSPSFIFYHLWAGVSIFPCLTIKTVTSLTKWTHNMRQPPYFCCPHQEPLLLTSLTTRHQISSICDQRLCCLQDKPRSCSDSFHVHHYSE